MEKLDNYITRDMWTQCRERCDERCQTCDEDLGELKHMCGKNTESIRQLQGATHALKSDGTAWAWGTNTYAELGDGGIRATNELHQIPGDHSFSEVFGMCGIKDDGTAWTWGN